MPFLWKLLGMLTAALSGVLTQDNFTFTSDKSRFVYENSTTYMEISDLISLANNDNYYLTPADPKASPNLKIDYFPLYQDELVLSYQMDIFVSSFGFRIGGISSYVFQMIFTHNFVYVYNLTTSGTGLALKLIDKWNVTDLVGETGKIYIANSTTNLVQRDSDRLEFIMVTIQKDTVNEVLVGLKLVCGERDAGGFGCNLTTTFNYIVTSMFFYDPTNTKIKQRCEATLMALNTTFVPDEHSEELQADYDSEDEYLASSDELQTGHMEFLGAIEDMSEKSWWRNRSRRNRIKQNNTKGADFGVEDGDYEFFFTRFCKLSQLPIEIQSNYSNRVLILVKWQNNSIELVHTIANISVAKFDAVAQATNFVEFEEKLIIFNLNTTYVIEGKNFSQLSTATAVYSYGDDLVAGFAECQQNDHKVLSCYMDFYTSTDVENGSRGHAETLLMSERRLLSATTRQVNPVHTYFRRQTVGPQKDGSSEGKYSAVEYYGSFFVEFLISQNQLFRIPPMLLSSITSSNRISAINLNFLIFRNIIRKGQNVWTELKILQRGTTFDLGTFNVSDEVISMQSMGPNFMMYHNSDVGLTVRRVSGALPSINISIYSVRLPYFKLTAGPNNPKVPCYSYLKECQPVPMIFSFRSLDTFKTPQRNSSEEYNLSTNLKHIQTSRLKGCQVGGLQDAFVSITFTYFHLNQNFSGILSKVLTKTMNLEIIKDRISVNITNLFYGLPLSISTRNDEISPEAQIDDFNTSTSFERYSDFRINITNLDFFTQGSDDPNISIKPLLSRYIDDSFFMSFVLQRQNQFGLTDKMWLVSMPDKIDSNLDSDFVFSLTSLTVFDLAYSMANFEIPMVSIVNDLIPSTHFYGTLYMTPGNETEWTLVIIYIQFDNGTAHFRTFTPIPVIRMENMRLRVQRSSSETTDDLLIIFNLEKVVFYRIFYDLVRTVPLYFEELMRMSIDDPYEWPVGHPKMIIDVALVDFNTLYFDLMVVPFPGSTDPQRIVQIHQCDFYGKPDCFFYTWINLLADQMVFIDDEMFNLVVLTPSSMALDLYRVTDFEREFLFMAVRELKPSRRLLIESLINVNDSIWIDRELFADNGFQIAAGRVFVVPISGDESSIGVLTFDMSQEFSAIRFSANTKLSIASIDQTRNSRPLNFPLVWSVSAKQGLAEIIALNPTNGFLLRSPQYSYNPTDGLYETEMYELELEALNSKTFIQMFRGGTLYNYEFRLAPGREVRGGSVDVEEILSGFVQNLSIFCLNNTEGRNFISRNLSITVDCNNSNVESMTLNPYVTKDFDFILNNLIESGDDPYEAKKSSSSTQDTQKANWRNLRWTEMGPGFIIDHFRLLNLDRYVVAMGRWLGIIEAGEHSRVLAYIIPTIIDSGEPLKLSNCVTIDEGLFIDDSLEINLICTEQSGYSLITITIDFTALIVKQKNATEPLFMVVPAAHYPFESQLISQIVLQNTRLQFVGGMLFVLDSIVLENYNNKPYLNVYEVNKNYGYVTLNLAFSSLSHDKMSNMNISTFTVVKSAREQRDHREYMLVVLSNTYNAATYSLVNITLKSIVTFMPYFSVSDNYPLQVSATNSFLSFAINGIVYMYGISDDTIQEWSMTNFGRFELGPRYKYAKVCEDTRLKKVYRQGDVFLLYCYNSTADGLNDDNMLVYIIGMNERDSQIYYPLQQVNFPDVDSPSNLILSLYKTTNNAIKFLMSSSQTYITQYTINNHSSIECQFANKNGMTMASIGFAAENILTVASSVVKFEVLFVDIAQDYLLILSNQIGGLLALFIYLFMVAALLLYRYVREKDVSVVSKNDEDFIERYRHIMDAEELRKNLRITDDEAN